MTARVTTHRSAVPGRTIVRYGTPSSFDFLGTVTKVADGCYTAATADGVELGGKYGFGGYRSAIAAVVKAARLDGAA